MTRRDKIIAAYLIAISLAIFVMLAILIFTKPHKKEVETQEPEREGMVIDGHNIEVVYDDYGAAYLKYIIGPMKIIYIPIPPEAELPDDTDSLKFYYTKTENNGRYNNKRNAR